MIVRIKGIAVQAMLRQMAIMNAAPYCGQALSHPWGGNPLLSSGILILLQML
jgi:hypothetical protein